MRAPKFLFRVREEEIPAWLGAAIDAASFGDLRKGAGHKYLRKVPTGNPKRPWRYFYTVTGGARLGHAEELQVGAKFAAKDAGKAGHFEITKDHGEHVTVRHDESGKRKKVSKAALAQMLHKEHATSIEGARAGLARRMQAAAKHGSEAQKERLATEARGFLEHFKPGGGAAPKPAPSPAAKAPKKTPAKPTPERPGEGRAAPGPGATSEKPATPATPTPQTPPPAAGKAKRPKPAMGVPSFGQTSTGRVVYAAADHPEHVDFTAAEHQEAADQHRKRAEKAASLGFTDSATYHGAQAATHAGASEKLSPRTQPTSPGAEAAQLERAVEVVRDTGSASVANLQRRLGVTYEQATGLIEKMAGKGLIGSAGSGGRGERQVLMERGAKPGQAPRGQQAGPKPLASEPTRDYAELDAHIKRIEEEFGRPGPKPVAPEHARRVEEHIKGGGAATASAIQKLLGVGYNQAQKLLDRHAIQKLLASPAPAPPPKPTRALVKSMFFEGGLDGLEEVPDWMGEALFASAEDRLEKAAGHKYIRRVATGNPKKPWRYFYAVTGGHGLAHDAEIQPGAKFAMRDAGKAGHFEVVSADADTVKIRHDETGTTREMTRAALRTLLHREHAGKLSAARGKARATLAAAERHGTGKQRTAARERLSRLTPERPERSKGPTTHGILAARADAPKLEARAHDRERVRPTDTTRLDQVDHQRQERRAVLAAGPGYAPVAMRPPVRKERLNGQLDRLRHLEAGASTEQRGLLHGSLPRLEGSDRIHTGGRYVIHPSRPAGHTTVPIP